MREFILVGVTASMLFGAGVDAKKEGSNYLLDVENNDTTTEEINTQEFTLKQMINEVVSNDPEIIEQIHQYKSTLSDLRMSQAGYLPKVDLYGKYGKQKDEDDDDDDTYDKGEASLSITQNIFNGFATQAAVYRDNARVKAAYKKFVEVAQSKIYSAVEAYINMLEYQEVLVIAKENVKAHEETLVRIKRRFDEGFSTLSEVERVEGRLALSRSNYIAETNNLYDAKAKFHKALGRWDDGLNLIKPVLNITLPDTLEKATKIALLNNPSLQVANADINASKGSLEAAKRGFYPTLDIELKGGRYKNQTSATSGNENEYSAMLIANYNLYNGGYDEANREKYLSLLNYEYAHRNKLKRDLFETLNLSWNAYKLLQKQRKYQVDYQNLTEKSKNSYTKEFQLGRRTLIDLLDVQDEVNNIRIQVIRNEYDLLFAEYRVADAMGKMFEAFDYSYEDKNIKSKNADTDHDGVSDLFDQCDNSVGEVTEYGCEKPHEIKVDKIEFNTSIKIDKSNDIDISEVKKLWNVK